MKLQNAAKFLPLVFILLLAAEKGPGNNIDELSSKFKRWNDSLPEDRVYVQSDKPFYSPGETIWFTVFVRDASSLKPSAKSDIVYAELINPKGSIDKQVALIAKKGIAKGDFFINEELPGGMYTLKVYTNWQKNDPDPAYFIKELQVQDVVLPRLKMKLDFARKAYGPSDKVIADLVLETNENKPLILHKIDFTVNIAGKQIYAQSVKSDNAGKAAISFMLPEKLTSNDGILNVTLVYDGQTESISRSIPIVINKISLVFYPEGGDLVSGLTSRVAFKAVNEFGKGADIEGYVVDADGKKISVFSSFHLGMGSFEITPSEGNTYIVHITKPSGIKDTYSLPEAMPQGYVLTVDNQTKSDLKLSVGSTREEKLRLFLQIRGKEYFSKRIDVKKGITPVSVDLAAFPAGVAQITLFDAKGIERAERLVFVNKHKKASVVIRTDKETYLPRGKVKLTITATDETGMRMPGHFAVAVTDDQLLSFSDDKSSTVMSHMLAESDIKGKVEEPRFYFDPKETKADQALDLLLLTNGWRRFTWKQIQEGDIPAAAFSPEKAVIAGMVVDGDHEKGVADAEVRIAELNLKTRTDSSGTFTFKNVELYEPKTIEATKGGLHSQVTVRRYTTSLQLRLFPHIRPLMRNNAARAFGAGGAAEVGVAMEAAVAAEQDMMVKAPVLPPRAVLPAMPFEEQKKDMPAERKMKAVEQPNEPKNQLLAKKIRHPGKEMKQEKHQGIIRDEAFSPEVAQEEPQEIAYYRVREYSMPDYREQQNPSGRTDFRSTIFWMGDVELGNNGTATVEFYTNDAVTSFRAISEGFTNNGEAGRAEHVFNSQMPFALSAKMPPVVITGDTISLQLLVKNTTAAPIHGKLAITVPPGLKLLADVDGNRSVEAGKSIIVHIKLNVVSVSDSAQLGLSFDGGGFSDAIKMPFRIISQGFPVALSFSGSELKRDYAVKIDNEVEHSIKASLMAYPSVVSDLLAGIESILQEPYGCFEQTSMTSYPNALVLSYLKTSDNADPQIVERAAALLDKGYKRLATFETKEKGYEWFGQNPGHEALTAYGLMQFSDMQKAGGLVDKAMVDRTADWLMKRRDNNGGFLRNPQALDSYGGADQNITNAYIVYALAEAGRRDIQKELDASVAYARESGDPYVIGLIANALYCFENFRVGDELLKIALGKQAADGSWCGLKHSITRSEGLSLKLETTALICMACMKCRQPPAGPLTSGIKFIVASRSGSGGFGATQSTILSLKALTAYAQFARKTDSPGTIIVTVDKKDVAKKAYAAGESRAIVIDSLEKYIGSGEHSVAVRFEGTKNALPYSLAVSYFTWKPASSQVCKVALETSAAASQVKVGQTLRITTTLKNTTEEGLPMTIAIIGLPAGLSPQPWQLKEIQEKKLVDFYEVSGSSVVFYYRQMKPGETRTINLDCKADIPGFYTAPASRAYLYYTNEHKVWSNFKPLKIDM